MSLPSYSMTPNRQQHTAGHGAKPKDTYHDRWYDSRQSQRAMENVIFSNDRLLAQNQYYELSESRQHDMNNLQILAGKMKPSSPADQEITAKRHKEGPQ